MTKDLILTSNSPGEITSWVKATVKSIKQISPDARIILALIPCPYATGREATVARMIPEIDIILTPWETSKFALGISSLPYTPSSQGVVGYLGGELWHALWLSKRLSYPAVAYVVKPSFWARFFHRVGTIDREVCTKLRLPPTRKEVVGDLMVDAFRAPIQAGTSSSSSLENDTLPPIIGLFPGSRRIHLRATLGPYLALTELLKYEIPSLEFKLFMSPFITTDDLEEATVKPIPLGLPNRRCQVAGDFLFTESGLQIKLQTRTSPQELRNITLALSIPGTNTAELACAGVPTIITLHALARIGGGGLSALLELLPIGSGFKKRLREKKYRRLRYTALPNIKAKRMLIPEIVIKDSLTPLKDLIIDLLEDKPKRVAIAKELQNIMGPPGASAIMARILTDACR